MPLPGPMRHDFRLESGRGRAMPLPQRIIAGQLVQTAACAGRGAQIPHRKQGENLEDRLVREGIERVRRRSSGRDRIFCRSDRIFCTSDRIFRHGVFGLMGTLALKPPHDSTRPSSSSADAPRAALGGSGPPILQPAATAR
eukprot:TRINITY_DN560_c0_g2_i1.p5 TRINITY_DN560_c0_g2~~TRINITY_DN560_c0_g2_i1.p5  ORF type:complete len:141 (+),score=17.68 TRINITY_DN560_c0_g2_i1:1298-1720(+)